MNSPCIQKGDSVLFIGDSITDATRNYEDLSSLGTGYVFMASGLFGIMYPELQVQFHNRGIGGNRITDLEQRWQQDCLNLKPNWISIMVGINDAIRRYDRDEHIETERYISIYRKLLTDAKQQYNSKFIIMEPYVMPTSELRVKCREDLDPKIHALRDLAQELGAIYVPLDGLFAAARSRASNEYWAPDGVHPTPAGHALIARAWLQAVGAQLQ